MKKILLIASLITTTIGAMAQTRLNNPKNPKELLNDKYASGLFKSTEGTVFDIENETIGGYFNILEGASACSTMHLIVSRWLAESFVTARLLNSSICL